MTKMPELPEPAAHLSDYSPVFSESQLFAYAKQYGRDLLEEAAKRFEAERVMVLQPFKQYTADDIAKAHKSTLLHCVAAIRAMKETI